MEPVGAAPVIDVDGRAGSAAVLGAHVVGDDPEFADRVGRRLHHLVGEALVARAVRVVVDAVDEEVIEHAAQAVDVERAFARRVPRRERRAGQLHARRQQRERRVLAAVQRQGAGLFARDHLAALARIGFDQRMRGRDIDSLGDLANRHLHVNPEPPADLELNVVDEPGPNPGFSAATM